MSAYEYYTYLERMYDGRIPEAQYRKYRQKLVEEKLYPYYETQQKKERV